VHMMVVVVCMCTVYSRYCTCKDSGCMQVIVSVLIIIIHGDRSGIWRLIIFLQWSSLILLNHRNGHSRLRDLKDFAKYQALLYSLESVRLIH